MTGEPLAVAFTVLGEPRPKGSMRAFVRGGHAVVTEGKGATSRTWQRLVAAEAQRHALPCGPLDGPLVVGLTFYLPRPASQSMVNAARPQA